MDSETVTRRQVQKNAWVIKIIKLFWPGDSADLITLAATGKIRVRYEVQTYKGQRQTRVIITSDWKDYDITKDIYE